MKRLLSSLSLIFSLIIIIPACSGPSNLHAVKGQFIEGSVGDGAQTLNWIVATDGGTSKRYAKFMVDPLAVFDNNFKPQLRCLAKDIEVSADGLTYAVSIRDDLRWTDGTKVTANDYVYTMKNLMFADWINYADKSKWQETVDGKAVFVSTSVSSDSTFKIVRKTVDPDFLYTIYDLMPFPKNIALHYENKADQFTQALEFVNMTYSGNLGPYKPVTWSSSEGFVLTRNSDYYLGKQTGAPYFEKYTIKQYGLQQSMQDDLAARKISYGYIEPQDANTFRGQSTTSVYTVPTGFYVYLAYNQRDNGWDGLKDVRVRQAISMMINKPAIINSLYRGYADPAFTFIPPYSPLYTETGLEKFGMEPDHDQQTAINLIKSAGYEQKEIDGQMKFVDSSGNPIKLNFLIDMGSDFDQNLGVLVRRCLLNIGLDVNPQLSVRDVVFQEGLMNKVPGSDQTPTFNNGPRAVSRKPWDLVILSSLINPLTLESSQEYFTSTGKFNLFGYSDPRVDALYKRARSVEAINPENRRQIYTELSQIISEAQPVDSLVFYNDNYAVSKDIKGIEPGVNWLYNYQFWYRE